MGKMCQEVRRILQTSTSAMTFSLVIPTYNGERYIEKALLSVLNQTRKPDEIIITDDNSTDATWDICKKYKNYIKLFKNKEGPSGFVNGWNKAIMHANGDYISILHQDDLLEPTFFEEMGKAILLHPAILHFFSLCHYINENEQIIKRAFCCSGNIKIYTGKEYFKAYFDCGNSTHIHRCPGVMTHRSLFKKCSYRSEAGHIADDDFFYRIGQFTEVVGILKPLASYRLHSFSETGHLNDVQLVRRLVADYTYQCLVAKNNSLLQNNEIQLFHRLRRKYALRLIGYGLRQGNLMDIFTGTKHLF